MESDYATFYQECAGQSHLGLSFRNWIVLFEIGMGMEIGNISSLTIGTQHQNLQALA